MLVKAKKVTINLPCPDFANVDLERETVPRRRLQERIKAALDDDANLFRMLLVRFYGEDMISAIQTLMRHEGPASETAEFYMLKVVNEFSVHSPREMFLYYLDTVDLCRADECFTFAPMQVRFLELVTRTKAGEVRCKCEDRAEEFEVLAEALGLPYPGLAEEPVFNKTMNQSPLDRVSVADILKGGS